MHSPLHRLTLCTVVASAMLFAVPASPAQEAAVTPTSPASVVPHLIKFAGALPGASSKAETVDVKFSLYAAQTGGEALWTETQQVSLDPTGKYSVLLGSTAALPDSVFAQGQARWIGVTLGSEQESPRTVLVATPYSLKASDSETLGGHPLSDFTLKNALPAGGTDVTQIDGTNGVVVSGSGTGPTVTLGLSSSYLETLGNKIYPQITGTNVMTGKNTYSSGKLFIGSSPVLSAANIVAGSDIILSTSGDNVTVNVNGPSLLKLANGYYPQLTTANAFTNANSFSDGVNVTGADVGLLAETTDTSSTHSYAVAGVTQSTGVEDWGVVGNSISLGQSAGVLGAFGFNLSGEGQTFQADFGGSGVWADSSQTGGAASTGLMATADDGNAGIFANNSPTGYYTVFIVNSDSTGAAFPFNAVNETNETSCYIDSSADLVCSGTEAEAHSAEGRKVATYGMQSSENWIEDFGSGNLSSGAATITLDHLFAATVNTGVDYHVFLTPEGDCKGLYIASKSTGGFEVRELGGGASSIAFSYRIVAKRKGFESARMEDITAATAKSMTANGHKAGTKAKPVQHPVRVIDVPLAMNVAASSTKK
jgi:hypothetical protein